MSSATRGWIGGWVAAWVLAVCVPAAAAAGPAVPAVEGLRATATATDVTLAWSSPGKAAVRVHRFAMKPPADGRRTPELGPVVAELPAGTGAYVDRAVEPGLLYVYRVTAVDRDGNEGRPSAPVLAVLVDETPPDPPSGLVAEAGEDGVVTIRWEPSPSPDVAQVQLFRRVGSDASWSVIGAFRPGTTRAEDRIDPWAGYTYHYAVAALDAGGNLGPRTPEVQVRAPDRTPPPSPVVTGVSSGADGTVTVRWAGVPGDDVAGYRLYRSRDGGEPAVVSEQPAGVSEATDRTAVPGVAYRYAVAAVDAAGNVSKLSAPAAARARVAPEGVPGPGAPSADREADGVRITWPAVASDALAGYFVYRSPDRDDGFVKLSGLVREPGFLDRAAPEGAWYRVRAFYAGGRLSAPSAAVTAPREAKP